MHELKHLSSFSFNGCLKSSAVCWLCGEVIWVPEPFFFIYLLPFYKAFVYEMYSGLDVWLQ